MGWLWATFIAFVLLMLAMDLGVFHRKARVVSVREGLAWSAAWLAMGLAFAVFVYFAYEGQWLTGNDTALNVLRMPIGWVFLLGSGLVTGIFCARAAERWSQGDYR